MQAVYVSQQLVFLVCLLNYLQYIFQWFLQKDEGLARAYADKTRK